ncbi:HAMP domain-containing histidine kinase [Tuanshanicoccus lijuaniae]|uniref:ATP-binding protein n=1 Tax=Aerococcaceae bacterium zg-1292 TaxID=2774330 RepID=UPI0019351E99|nr:HAMP domain-containing histidine kinase [Aerococcaceae bacterium zg-1292]MBF6979265.1 HAMP domain-containing histidine kinase [Aerococcaceae bacterium zg-BR22]MBS4456917.1 HAMP domain-containing histidine kinase [Aerococcaceae bacterium zg-A91]MBS4458856.1 HAMP domain-containing histidine kinase [Aerococcaceae bacterium zg-BR33]QQA36981.1 HAMP domain-containing histidine kinase [Aerococcaceae bacterium zg-1292]
MKLLWQQILSVMSVLLVALSLSAYLTSRYMSQQIFDQKQKQLVAYGMNIVANKFTRNDLERATKLMANDDIVIQVYLADGTVIYPSYDQRNKLQLSQEQLERITNDETIGIQRSYRYNRDGQRVSMATVYVSNKGGYSEFPEGFISIGAPLSELDEQVRAVQHNIMLAFGISAAIGIAMAVVYAMYQVRRIKRLQVATEEIISGNYQLALNVQSQDEFGDLARDFQHMADALRHSEEEIQRQEKIRRQMMMDAAHEMRTPLTTMSGVLEGLQYDMIPENQKERSLALIMKETQRLIRLVNENLDYEKIRNRQIVLKQQRLNVLQLLEQIKTQLLVKAEQKGIHIEVNANEQLDVWADYDRIIQILINIVNNAIQFSENSPITLSAVSHDEGVLITVADKGIGIDAKQIENIWERFYKADISRKNTKFGESGIGLAVVKSLVEAHGGSIQVESELGKGTTFTMYFPASEVVTSDRS